MQCGVARIMKIISLSSLKINKFIIISLFGYYLLLELYYYIIIYFNYLVIFGFFVSGSLFIMCYALITSSSKSKYKMRLILVVIYIYIYSCFTQI